MPHKGFKQPLRQRKAIAEGNRQYRLRVAEALASFKPKPRRPPPAPPQPTPVPPSASAISEPTLQRWACYSHHIDGRYFYKREQADNYLDLRRQIKKCALPFPLWMYVKSAHTEKDLFMPIRIPEEAIKLLGQRWQELHRYKPNPGHRKGKRTRRTIQ